MKISKRVLGMIIFCLFATMCPMISPAQGDLPAVNAENDNEVLRYFDVLEVLELLEQEPGMLREYDHYRDLNTGGVRDE